MLSFPRSLKLGLRQAAALDVSRLLLAFEPGISPSSREHVLALHPELSRESGADDTGATFRLNEGPNHVWVRVAEGAAPRLIAALEKRPEIAWVGPVYRLANEPGLLGLFCPPPRWLLLDPAHHLRQEAGALAAALAHVGLSEVAERSKMLGDYLFCVVRDANESAFEIAERVEAMAFARSVSFDAIPLVSPLHMAAPVGEAFWPQQNMLDIHMDAAWDLPLPLVGTVSPNLGVNRVYACLIDNGAQSFTGGGGNSELVRPGNFGWDISGVAAATLGGPTAPAAAEGGHGTACAGIIGADWETTSGVVGISPLSSIFSLALAAPAAVSDVTAAINAAVNTVLPNADPAGTADRDKQHRRVILLSAFHNAFAATPALSTAIANAIAADVPVIIPTGNGDASTIPYPATDPGVIVCGAVLPTTGTRASGQPVGHGTNNGTPNWGSNFSATQPFACAPGFAIKTTDLNGASGYGATGYVTDFQGTSAAAAHAAGLAVLLLAHNPRLTANDVRTILYATAEKIGGAFTLSDPDHPDGSWNQNVGYGRINALAAVTAARIVRADVQEITGASPLICEFGNVEFRRTGQIDIRLQHITSLCTNPITFVLPTVLPTHCQWAPATPPSVTLASGMNQVVSLQYVAPSATEEINGSIVFLTDDYLARSFTLSVHAKSIAPPVVDSVVVLDRSGSMSASTTDAAMNRSQVVAAATSLYIDLLEDEDHLGIVRFSTTALNPADVLAPMTLAGPLAGGRPTLQNAITVGNPLAPSGNTSIGGGMILGSQILDTQPPEPDGSRRALVVMTDGEQNTAPEYPAAYAQINAAANGVPRVFAVGVGLARVDSAFDAIVNVTGGYSFPTGPLVSDTVVHKLFAAILANAADAVFATDPDYTLLPGQKQSTPVVIGDTDFQVDFIVVSSTPGWFPRSTHVWLEAPDGTVLEAADILAGSVPSFRGVYRGQHLVLRGLLPPFAQLTRHIGTWRLWVQNGFGLVDGKPQLNERAQGGSVLSYTAMSTVKSDLRLKGHLIHPSLLPGDPFVIVLEPTLYGVPVALSGSPEARVVRPDGSVILAPLTRTSSHAYEAEFTDTGLPGVYVVNAEVQATTPKGIVITRYLQLRTVVEAAGAGSVGGGPEGGAGSGIGGAGGSSAGPTRTGCLCGIIGVWCRFWRGCCSCCNCDKH